MKNTEWRIIPGVSSLELRGIPADIRVEVGEIVSVTVRAKTEVADGGAAAYLERSVADGGEELHPGISLRNRAGRLVIEGLRETLVVLPSKRNRPSEELVVTLPAGAAILVSSNFGRVTIGDGGYDVAIANGRDSIEMGRVRRLSAGLSHGSRLLAKRVDGDLSVKVGEAEMRFPGGVKDFQLKVESEAGIYLSYDLLEEAAESQSATVREVARQERVDTRQELAGEAPVPAVAMM